MTSHSPSSPAQTPAYPAHVAIILDGNGRWANRRGLPRVAGHPVGADRVRDIVREAGRLGVKYLTLFALSLDNRKRPEEEVEALFQLLRRFAESEQKELLDQDVRVEVVGDIESLPRSCQDAIGQLCEVTAGGKSLVLRLAVAYGAREDLVRASRSLARKVARGELRAEDICEATLRAEMWTAGAPSPDLIIRTGGDHRLSDFLLLEAAYSELYFTPDPWPEFTPRAFQKALDEFCNRDRRFGLVKTNAYGGVPASVPPSEASPN